MAAERSRHVDAQQSTRVLVDHVTDADCRHDLDKVGRDAAVQAEDAFLLDYSTEDARHSRRRGIYSGMDYWKRRYIYSKQILNNGRYGFRPNKSTEDMLASLTQGV